MNAGTAAPVFTPGSDPGAVPLTGLASVDTLFVALIVAAGGFVRGVTGFGGAMAIAPAASALLGPAAGVMLALTMEAAAAATMLRGAMRLVDRRTMIPICAAAAATTPLGGLALAVVDPEIMTRAISVMVLGFVVMLATGARWRGPRGTGVATAVGGVSGVLVGAVGAGAPPVIIYLLSGPDPVARTRANLILFVSALSAVGLLTLIVSGVAARQDAVRAAILAPVFLLTAWAGARVFARLDERRFRRATLALLAAASLAAFLA